MILLEVGADVNTAFLDGMTCLMYTVREGNYQATKLMIVYNASVNMKTRDNNTALTMACYPSRTLNIEIVRLLLENGADVNATNPSGRTCLMSRLMNSEAVQLLLDYKADVNMKDENGLTALHYVEDIEVIRLLLENGADPNIKDNYGRTALHVAKLYGLKEIENLLLEKGASPLDENEKQELTNNKLLLACDPQKGIGWSRTRDFDLKELQRLLAAGADINYTSERFNNRTCLMTLVVEGEVEATRMMLEKKADVNKKDYEGMTALHYASLLGKIKVVRLLLENGADPDIKDNHGFSPLFYAALGDKKRVEKLLLEKGASPLDENEKQELINNKLIRTCNLWPKEELEAEMIKIKDKEKELTYDDIHELSIKELERLLAAGADINYKDITTNNTCLMKIVRKGGVEAIKKVLDRNVDVNIQGYNGWTALHSASYRGNLEVVRLLLDNGADPDIKDNDGRTAVQRTKNMDIEKLLLKAIETTDDDKGDGENKRRIILYTKV